MQKGRGAPNDDTRLTTNDGYCLEGSKCRRQARR